jgi:hypothetical protein
MLRRIRRRRIPELPAADRRKDRDDVTVFDRSCQPFKEADIPSVLQDIDEISQLPRLIE